MTRQTDSVMVLSARGMAGTGDDVGRGPLGQATAVASGRQLDGHRGGGLDGLGRAPAPVDQGLARLSPDGW